MKACTLNQTLPACCFGENFEPSTFDGGPIRLLCADRRSRRCGFRRNGPGSKFQAVVAMACQVLTILIAPNRSDAQPVNDNFADAIPVANYWVTLTGNNAYATREPGDPTAGDKSVWWSWTAPTSGVYTVTAIGLPGYFQPFLGVYAGTTVSSLTLVAGNSYYDDYTARVTFKVVSAATYRIAVTTVSGFGGDFSLSLVPSAPPSVTITHPTNNATVYDGDTVVLRAEASDSDGTIINLELYLDYDPVQQSTSNSCELSLLCTNGPCGQRLWARATDSSGITSISSEVDFTETYPPPVNDNFADATPVTNYWVTLTGNNAYATREPGDPTAGGNSVWWSWKAPTPGLYTVTAVGIGLL
jgi:hypothetical protein